MLSKKICMVGRFGVGKTSLVDRYVKNHFSEKYHTTVGVSISTKIVSEHIKLIIWDIAGFEQENHYVPYLRGTHGIIYVADSTNPESVSTLATIQETNPQLSELPSICFINKKDLTDQRVWGSEQDSVIQTLTNNSIWTSAKTGEDVEKGFIILSQFLK
ncbi:Rab family GTPase [Marinicella rhabdoformis]|uniref:Rab family GTPase n=1 Tax=Marinicella rhabdoformis TaxID=2580566 RepID=UPI0015D0ACC4|nr:Rab family GTPase [Marinicella rhabdoformis]